MWLSQHAMKGKKMKNAPNQFTDDQRRVIAFYTRTRQGFWNCKCMYGHVLAGSKGIYEDPQATVRQCTDCGQNAPWLNEKI